MPPLARLSVRETNNNWNLHRFFLPIPHRQPILMAISKPIVIKEKVANPTQSQIDEVHAQMVKAHQDLFEKIKPFYGEPYASKELLITS